MTKTIRAGFILAASAMTSAVVCGADGISGAQAEVSRVTRTATAVPGPYQFDRTISRAVLENYLSRAITMEGLLNGRGDLTDNIRMLKGVGAKFIGRSLCLWGGESRLVSNLERARQQVPLVHATDPEIVLQACIFEIVTTEVDQVPVPEWAFAAFGLPAEKRTFRYAEMLYPDGQFRDHWRPGQSVPDVSRPETKLYFYFLGASYLDVGCEAIHLGQTELMNHNDRSLDHYSQVLALIRDHAAKKARRHMVLLDSHVPSGGLVRQGNLLMDFHSFPLRIKEVPDKPQEAILELGFSDGIYGRSKGGMTFSGWQCEHMPYLVEIDNWGVSRQPGQAKAGSIWVWGYDEITWFAHQSREYRRDWLGYAWDWVRQTDPNGYLQMPGSRTLRSPQDSLRWYYANNPSPAVPEGFGDEAAIYEVWAGDAAKAQAPRQMENLNRGIVAVKRNDGGIFVSWRLFATDPATLAFNLYRVAEHAEPVKVNRQPITAGSNYLDEDADPVPSLEYFLRPVLDGRELAASGKVRAWDQEYLEIPIQTIPGYQPGDASVADLDGDGDYELVLHQTSRGRDNSFPGITGTPVLDAYEFDGTHLWRIDLGKNIREGEHYTQFMVYDLDGDGRAEVACKTADGTIDGKGKIIGDPGRDWRVLEEGSRRYGRILDGPEYFTVFDGQTGAALKTVDYIPSRDPINGWGGIGGNGGNDDYGNRCDRFLACVAYLDGERPSVVMCRGVYGRTVMAAWDWHNGELTLRWVFDSGISYPPFADASPFSGMGGHSLSVADVDGDGRDEIVYQALTVDDDGQGLYTTGRRHGDAMHLSDFYPDRPGLEVFLITENEDDTVRFQTPGVGVHDARTGEVIWSHHPGIDVGGGLAADIDPRHPGYEAWGGPGGLWGSKGEDLGPKPNTSDWAIWWDGDLLRELLRGTRISKWNWEESIEERLFNADTDRRQRRPNLVGDILGDWREELLLVGPEGDSLRLHTTTIPTEHRIYTLMHDPQYRLGIAWQNVVYNKPAHPGFFLGEGMASAPRPRIQLVGRGEAVLPAFPVQVQVEASSTTGALPPIWRFFGADEPNYAYMKQGKKLLAELGALAPRQVYFRAHNLLTSGDGTPALKWGSTGVYREDDAGEPIYDWVILDRIFDTYLERGVRPYVEIGFMPRALSVKPEPYQHRWTPAAKYDEIYTGWAYPPKDYQKWAELVFQWVRHCVERYGPEEVESWYWETWNEANIGYWRGTPEEFRKLHDYAVDAVRRALPNARVGGPDVAGSGGRFTRDFLEHCLRGTNHATGRRGTPLDFVAFHAKGSPKFVDGHVRMGIANQLRTINEGFGIVASFPELKDTPVIIGESDPEGCAACQGPQLAYRNGTMYSSYTAASFTRKLDLAEKHGIHFEGALTWAFEFEDQPYFAGFRSLASNGIDKPVLNVFRMFSLMSGRRVKVESDGAVALADLLKSGVREKPDVSALASVNGDRLFILLWHYHDDDLPGPEAAIDLRVAGLGVGSGEAKVRRFLIDQEHSNAFALWKRMGSPQTPTDEQYARLEAAGQLAELTATTAGVENGTARIRFGLPRQAVSLLILQW